jgi:hypothetical protein
MNPAQRRVQGRLKRDGRYRAIDAGETNGRLAYKE